jgi:DNA polymerase/3'-5' exonuclease PolX
MRRSSRSVVAYLVALRDRSVKSGANARFVHAAYNAVIANVREHKLIDDRVIDAMDITSNMKEKLRAIIRGEADATEQKQMPHAELKQQLEDVLGIGAVKADELLKAGLKSMSQLHTKKWQDMLPEGVRIILQHKLSFIPRKVIAEVERRLPGGWVAGSYRRGALHSKDIDVVMVGTPATLRKYVKIVLAEFGGVVYMQGDDKASLVLHKPRAKMDVFRAAPDERVAMLTYATGSKQFNIQMRAAAKKLGYLLNQRGLFDRATGARVDVRTEKGLFKKLKLAWVEPTERR